MNIPSNYSTEEFLKEIGSTLVKHTEIDFTVLDRLNTIASSMGELEEEVEDLRIENDKISTLECQVQELEETLGEFLSDVEDLTNEDHPSVHVLINHLRFLAKEVRRQHLV